MAARYARFYPETLPKAAAAAGSPTTDTEKAAVCDVFRAHLERAIETVNETLARYETIKKFAVLPHPFSIEGGELTPTMKMKRRVIHDRYAREIEGLY